MKNKDKRYNKTTNNKLNPRTAGGWWRQCLLIVMTLRSSRVTARQGGNLPLQWVGREMRDRVPIERKGNVINEVNFWAFTYYSYLVTIMMIKCKIGHLRHRQFAALRRDTISCEVDRCRYDEMQTVCCGHIRLVITITTLHRHPLTSRYLTIKQWISSCRY